MTRTATAVLRALASDPLVRHLPVIVATSSELSPDVTARLTHDRAVLAKQALTAEALAAALQEVGTAAPAPARVG